MIRVLQFKTEYRTGKDPVDWVLLSPVGADFQKTQTWQRVAKIRPPADVDDTVRNSLGYQDMEAKWSIIGPAYDAWKQGEALPDDGTPLSAWSGVSPEQAKFLHSLNIRTVEEVRDMGESTVEKLRWPNSRRLPELAKAYLEGESGADKDARIAEMEAQIAAMAEMMAENGIGKAEPAPKKRGRPKKAQVEAA
jgi:hypothetical protein